jgi:CDP-diacylglycerol--glycerol-3-phosphate 3-phosphatidyltransferase
MPEPPGPARWQRALPWCLVGLRVLLAPVALALAWLEVPGSVWLLTFALAIWSDVYDGRFARRFGVVTAGLRRADSAADHLNILAVHGSALHAHPEAIRAHGLGIAAVLGLEAARFPLDRWKFGRAASYHATSARLFGATLVVAVVALMGFGSARPWLWIALGTGVVSELEGVAISLVLPAWTHDVPSLRAALRIRAQAAARED